MELFLLFGYVGWAIINGLIAEDKGREATKIFALSFLITPVIPYLYLLAVSSKKQEQQLAKIALILEEQAAASPTRQDSP